MVTLQKLYAARAALDKRIRDASVKLWPVGSDVHIHKWGGDITAEVVAHADFFHRLRVLNRRTGKQYWLDYAELANRW